MVRRWVLLALGVLGTILSWLPAPVRAQGTVIVVPFGQYGRPAYYPFGGQNFGGYNLGYNGWWRYPGIYPGSWYPGHAGSGIPSRFAYSGPVFFPNFDAFPETPAMRTALFPAVAVNPGSADIGAAGSVGGPEARASVEVRVPAMDAKIWFQGVFMEQSGLERKFVTPVLGIQSQYHYEVRVRWQDSHGQEINLARTITVKAGERVRVDFTTKN